ESSDLELTMRRRDRSTFDALWSAQWSPDERALFCVIRDQSDRVQAERMKQEVLAMVTHDLRTPLMVVQTFVQFIENGHYGSVNDRGAKFLTGAKQNCRNMLDLINDMLDAEKIKSGMMSIEAGEVDLEDVIKQSVELLEPVADGLGVKLLCATQPLV